MKKIYSNLLCMSLSAALLVFTAACGKEDTTPAPVFPTEITALTGIEAGTEQEIKFEANRPWKLSSDASWCTFIQDGFKDLGDISGEPGKHTAKLYISDVNQKFDSSSKANITLTMDKESKVIATIERVPMGYKLVIVDAQKQPVESLVLEYNKDLEVVVRANFNYSYSELDKVNIIRKDSVFTLSVKKGFEKNAITGLNFSLMDEAGKFNKDVPVIYEGMDPNEIDITLPQGCSRWNWTVSADGKTLSQASGVSGTNELQDALTCKAVALNDDYSFVCMEEYQGKWYAGAQWIEANGNGEDVTVTFQPNDSGKDRNGYVLAFSKAKLSSLNNTIQSWVAAGTDESFADDYGYNVVFQGTQKAASQGGGAQGCMTVVNGTTYAEIPVSPVTGDFKDYFVSEYNVTEDNLASITVPAGTVITVNPLMPELANAMAYNSEGSLINDFNMEFTLDQTEQYMLLMAAVPENAADFIFIVFQEAGEDDSFINKKILLINIGEGGSQSGGSTIADIIVKNSLTMESINTDEVQGEFLDFFASEYSLTADQMAMVSVPKGTSIAVYPNVENLGNYMVFDLKGPRSDIELSFLEDTNGMMYGTLTCPNDSTTDFFYIVFQALGTDGETLVNKRILGVMLQ